VEPPSSGRQPAFINDAHEQFMVRVHHIRSPQESLYSNNSVYTA